MPAAATASGALARFAGFRQTWHRCDRKIPFRSIPSAQNTYAYMACGVLLGGGGGGGTRDQSYLSAQAVVWSSRARPGRSSVRSCLAAPVRKSGFSQENDRRESQPAASRAPCRSAGWAGGARRHRSERLALCIQRREHSLLRERRMEVALAGESCGRHSGGAVVLQQQYMKIN